MSYAKERERYRERIHWWDRDAFLAAAKALEASDATRMELHECYREDGVPSWWLVPGGGSNPLEGAEGGGTNASHSCPPYPC